MERIEVVLRFNGVEDLKGFKIKQLVPRGSLKELKGLCCVQREFVKIVGSWYLGHHDNQGRQIYYQTFSTRKSIALKAEHNSSNVTSYSEEEIMMLTRDFGKFLRRTSKTSIPQGRFKM
ncbi:hypothetical protein M9H77_13172 [Catharanthus roseus]|uniref:Uncharacterized protein n=1 Tax=Catharanthus roseus TaxID=4058 RepID=A0ACC0BJM3_CATRO|nr:hypothetical protein M9H77_13172 [Catharanthus roseus]